MWIQRLSSWPPASSSTTRVAGSSLSRAAMTQPAEPAPTTTKSASITSVIALPPLRRSLSSESDPIAALQFQDLAGLLRRRDLQAEFLQDAADFCDLLGVRLGQRAASDIQTVLQPDAHVAAHDAGHGGERHLVAPGGQHRPDIGVAEQLVRSLAHEQQVALVGADAAEDAEDGLHEQRRLDDLLIQAIGQVVQMADVVAFELEARAVRFAQPLDDAGDILEGVAED